jgi:hypothetical protein
VVLIETESKLKNKEPVQFVKDFIEENQNLFMKFLDTDQTLKHEMNAFELQEGINIDYAPKSKKFLLGLNMGSSPHFVFYLFAWIALKNDIKDKDGNTFFYYDSDKMWVNTESSKIRFSEDCLPLKDPKISQKLQDYYETYIDFNLEYEIFKSLNMEWENKLKKKIKMKI